MYSVIAYAVFPNEETNTDIFLTNQFTPTAIKSQLLSCLDCGSFNMSDVFSIFSVTLIQQTLNLCTLF